VGHQVQVNSAVTGGTTVGEIAFVSSFTSPTLTFAPAFDYAIKATQEYELWEEPYTIEAVNNVINQAIISATDEIITDKVDSTSLIKLANVYEYAIPTGFVALYDVEYEYSVGVKHLLSDCESAWTAATSVTSSADSTFEKVGAACAKLVVADAAASGATLCYEDITEVDISDSDKVEFWMYSSIALTAGQLQFMLGATAAIASPLETIDIPAMSAATWYKHSLSLANPHSDTAIISIGVRQASGTDVGAFTFYIDEVAAILDKSRVFKPLRSDHWGIVQASTNLLQLDTVAYSIVGNNKMLRLSGYQIPAELTDDTTACTIDPEYVVAYTTAMLLMSHARSSDVDPNDSYRRANYFMNIAEKRKFEGRTSLAMGTRWVT